jgi:hypothetical protein
VPLAVLVTWIAAPAWAASFAAGGWHRLAALAAWAAILVGVTNVLARRNWFRRHYWKDSR